ncbi:hypothetical protein [Nocardioides sp.]|uniref:hypothetical protein n=1 Tax=Nocardioides sp. TaxID=35761 RepID=UPI002D810410|nr:hypothetical protein [Nocardioides sp.]HET8960023.1 hypothetical protein [Nocardioides sp.]
MIRRSPLLALAATLPLLVTGCGSAPQPSPPTGVDGLRIPTPSADPDDFVEGIDNPFLPLEPGSRWVYETGGVDPETITVTVTDDTRVVQGVKTTVVRDVVRDSDGAVVEETFDWFAQDAAGNVWYFGEDTTEYDDRGRPDRSGSWEAGVDGARAGLAMPAEPRVGDGYQQEAAPGRAEDRAEVLSVDESLNVAFDSYTDVLQTEDTTPLEPGLVERKYYAPGVGLVLEETVLGGSERAELVAYEGG